MQRSPKLPRADSSAQTGVHGAVERETLRALLAAGDFSGFIEHYNSNCGRARRERDGYDRFYDIVAHNYAELAERYRISAYVNASLVSYSPALPAFIPSQFPKEAFRARFLEAVESTGARLVVSLINDELYRRGRADYMSCGAHKLVCALTVSAPEGERLVVERFSRRGPAGRARRASVDVRGGVRGALRDEIDAALASEGDVVRIRYGTWRDNRRPDAAAFRALYEVYRYVARAAGAESAVVVHCLAGAGRTGTFIMFCILEDMRLRAPLALDDAVDVFLHLRSARAHMVQTGEQLEFVFESCFR